MSGHSKWHNIKLRKGKQDLQRGKIFTKLAREIIVAAKEGGGNPDSNLALRMAVQKARENSMPADNIKRAIQRGTGEIEGASYEEIIYEGYGPAGVAILVSTLTDNRNRTVAELRNIFSKNGGNLGEMGCVAWMFDAKGMVQVPADKSDEETVMMTTMDAGAEDIKVEDDIIEVLSSVEDLGKVRDALTEAGIPFTAAELTRIPQTTIRVEDIKEASRIIRLMDALEDNDDVQQAYANFDIPDEILQEAAG
ncbi:MAG: YebC/PmpR family DNA-binding transcriptional regulator [Armatimonadota bacterium]|nr:YebC/PmpR family DNA-binding transcriptional regulator [bacterium]